MSTFLSVAAGIAALSMMTPLQTDAYARAMQRCETSYVKKTNDCRKAVGNYRCLQDVLDRLTICRERAAAAHRAPTNATPAEAPRPRAALR